MGEVNAPRAIADSDDLSEFRCGRETLDDWLRERAIKNLAAEVPPDQTVCRTRSSLIVHVVTPLSVSGPSQSPSSSQSSSTGSAPGSSISDSQSSS